MRGFLMAAAAALPLLSVPAAQAAVVAGGWEVSYDGKATCMMVTEYDAGRGAQAAVAIGIAQNGLILSFVSERWNMKPGAVFKVKMTIDRAWEQTVKVRAEDSDTLVIVFDYSRELLNTIASGNKITLDDGNDAWSFTLNGTQAAVPKLLQCAKQNVW